MNKYVADTELELLPAVKVNPLLKLDVHYYY